MESEVDVILIVTFFPDLIQMSHNRVEC